MSYAIKPLPCDPTAIKGMSERLIVSHYENNYGGAVNRLNAITAQLAGLDFATTPSFIINGLKREELIATNSMILHELFFSSLGQGGEPDGTLADALASTSGLSLAGKQSFPQWVKRWAAVRVGCCSVGRPATASSSINGRWITRRPWPGASRSSRSICMSTPITWTMEREPQLMSTRSWPRSTGRT